METAALQKHLNFWLKLFISEKRNRWLQFFITQTCSADQEKNLQSLKNFCGADPIIENLGCSESDPQNFLNFAESFTLACWLHFRNKKTGLTEFVFQILANKAKIWGVFPGLSCCHSNFLRHKNDRMFLDDTITLLLGGKTLSDFLISYPGKTTISLSFICALQPTFLVSCSWNLFFLKTKQPWSFYTGTYENKCILLLRLRSNWKYQCGFKKCFFVSYSYYFSPFVLLKFSVRIRDLYFAGIIFGDSDSKKDSTKNVFAVAFLFSNSLIFLTGNFRKLATEVHTTRKKLMRTLSSILSTYLPLKSQKWLISGLKKKKLEKENKTTHFICTNLYFSRMLQLYVIYSCILSF